MSTDNKQDDIATMICSKCNETFLRGQRCSCGKDGDMREVSMKRFMLFCDSLGTPCRGAREYNSSHDTLEQAIEEASKLKVTWANVLDTANQFIVWDKGKQTENGYI